MHCVPRTSVALATLACSGGLPGDPCIFPLTVELNPVGVLAETSEAGDLAFPLAPAAMTFPVNAARAADCLLPLPFWPPRTVATFLAVPL